jgi:hypothetical protein
VSGIAVDFLCGFRTMPAFSWGIRMETALQLLMRDGAVQMKFHPRLTVEQYAELMTIVDNATTRAELCYAVEVAVERWGIKCECSEVGV